MAARPKSHDADTSRKTGRMTDYQPPVDDIITALCLFGGINDVAQFPEIAHADRDTVTGLLTEYGRLIAKVIAPLNKVGDLNPAQLDHETHSVTTAPGFKEAYRQYMLGGWPCVPFAPAFGGGGFPWSVAIAMNEMVGAANLAFSLCPLLGQGAIDAITHHGSAEQKAMYLEKLVLGTWTGTMNLTEPEAGSDVGALRTRAVKHADGTWRIFGQKIFITYGDHDFTDNIVHLVLARIDGAGPGTKGISCFLVPKFLVNADGSLGARNDANVVSLEHKMGIHASPTCVMAYGDQGEGALGELLGEPNDGMRTMFTMMNNARLGVGTQGLALADRAYQMAATYAAQRTQGRAVGAPAGTESPIIEHPDVQRMLLTMQANVAAMRSLIYTNAGALDAARHHLDADARNDAKARADLLTPLSKAWSTDLGVEMTSVALQVFGGMGFVEETGIAQLYRDSRVAPIYEGTNAIQAIDLVTRKITIGGGALIAELFDDAERAAVLAYAPHVIAVIALAREATTYMLDKVASAPSDALAGATPYLRLVATAIAGGLMATQASQPATSEDEIRRVHEARFFCDQLAPLALGLLPSITSGAGALARR